MAENRVDLVVMNAEIGQLMLVSVELHLDEKMMDDSLLHEDYYYQLDEDCLEEQCGPDAYGRQLADAD